MKKYKLKKNVNVKNNYRKIKKKQDNDVNADLAQQGCSNNKCYTSAFIYIYIYICVCVCVQKPKTSTT